MKESSRPDYNQAVFQNEGGMLCHCALCAPVPHGSHRAEAVSHCRTRGRVKGAIMASRKNACVVWATGFNAIGNALQARCQALGQLSKVPPEVCGYVTDLCSVSSLRPPPMPVFRVSFLSEAIYHSPFFLLDCLARSAKKFLGLMSGLLCICDALSQKPRLWLVGP